MSNFQDTINTSNEDFMAAGIPDFSTMAAAPVAAPATTAASPAPAPIAAVPAADDFSAMFAGFPVTETAIPAQTDGDVALGGDIFGGAFEGFAMPAPVVDNAKTNTTAVTAEKASKEVPVEKVIEEKSPAIEEQKETPAAEEKVAKPTRKVSSRRSARKNTPPDSDNSNPSTIMEKALAKNGEMEPFTMEMDPNMSIPNIISSLQLMPDGNFKESRKNIEKKMNLILIRKDLDLANAMDLNDKIDELSDIIYSQLACSQTMNDNFNDKETGFLASVKVINSNGSSEADRKRNGYLALMNYKDNSGKKVNLLQAAWAVRYEYNFFKNASLQIENKRRLLKAQIDMLTTR